jgi:acetolactate synthase-1/2/3 large subunit
MRPPNYGDEFVGWLEELGYTHCFFVAGGNIMHLLDSVRRRLVCIPVVHEVAAGIAAEYFNETRQRGGGRAFALVTAGPGLTNIVTAVAGAWQESRELLVVGGQVKSSDLSLGLLRQRGIQEIDGVAVIQSITKAAVRLDRPLGRVAVEHVVRRSWTPRRGPVFIEMCLDVQAAPPTGYGVPVAAPVGPPTAPASAVAETLSLLRHSRRPVILIGGGVTHFEAMGLRDDLARLGVPLMTTYNGADRLPADHPLYFGRPNTWGQRAANVLFQQADLVIAIGTRLGLQQTGFNHQEFAPLARVVQVDIDPDELTKGHPRVHLPVLGDADSFLRALVAESGSQDRDQWSDWRVFCREVSAALPLEDPANVTRSGYVCPYRFARTLAQAAGPGDVLVPCSSGGAFTVSMQAIRQRGTQRVVTNKSLASMGYGLSAAIGAALANPDRKVLLVEGDGGFAQNLQELGTLERTGADVAVFIWANDGYASIRMTQRNYFDGGWIGCDSSTGLGLPDWGLLARAFNIPFATMSPEEMFRGAVGELLDAGGPSLILVPIDPDQTYYPKITSRVSPGGSMESNPLHLLSPSLSDEVSAQVFRYFGTQSRGGDA